MRNRVNCGRLRWLNNYFQKQRKGSEVENYLKSLSIQLLDLEAQSPLMSNEKFRSEAISFLKGLLKIVNALIPAEKQSNFEGLKNLGIDKFIPTHEELLQWGFIEINAKTIWRKVIREVYFYYQPEINELEKLIGSTNYGYIPFHTKQDFVSAIGIQLTGKKVYCDYQENYVPSEKTLIDLEFKKWQEDIPHQFVRSFGKFVFQKAIYYNSSTKQFHYFFNDTSQKIFFRSDSELKTLVEIFGREK